MTAVGEGRKGALRFVQHEAAGRLMLLVAAIAALCRLLGVALQCPCAARIAGRSFVSRLCAVIGPTCL